MPPVDILSIQPVTLGLSHETHYTDYYGALRVAAAYSRTDPSRMTVPGMWQHGCTAPWRKLPAEIRAFLAPKQCRCFVGRDDDRANLLGGGYRRVRAIGLPIVYTRPSGASRVPGSLLVMPTHSMPWSEQPESLDAYTQAVAAIRSRFSKVVLCVSAHCLDNDYGPSHFRRLGIEVVRGAGINDANSLPRIRMLMESFDFVTSNGWGSHVAYAMYFGAKMSIWGPAFPPSRTDLMKDTTLQAFPETVELLLSQENVMREREYLRSIYVEPWAAVPRREFGGHLVGDENKLSPFALKYAFGWTPMHRVARKLRALPRRAARIRKLLSGG